MRASEIITEAANLAQQAAIAIAMKKAGKKPKNEGMSEGEVYDLEKEYGYEKAPTQSRRSAPSNYPYSQQDDDAYFREIFRKKREAAKKAEQDGQQGVAEGETWAKHNNPRAGGMSKKSVKSYRRSHPGSKIQTAVTTKPSKLKKGSKAAKRRASFCARMRGMKKHRTGAKTARDPNSNINKSLRRWNCESIEQLQELVMIAEQYIRNNKK